MRNLLFVLVFIPFVSVSQTYKIEEAFISEVINGKDTLFMADFAPSLYATFSSIAIITSSPSGKGSVVFKVEHYEYDENEDSRKYRTSTFEGETVYFTLYKEKGVYTCRWEGEKTVYMFAISIPK